MTIFSSRTVKGWVSTILLLSSCASGASERIVDQDGFHISERYLVDNIDISPAEAVIDHGEHDYVDITITADGYDNTTFKPVTIPATIIEQHTYLAFKGSDERLPKQNTAAPNKWAFEVLPAQAGNALTLRVRSQEVATATLCVWIKDKNAQGGWHNSCTDNVDIDEKSVQITKTPPPPPLAPPGTPVAVVDWSSDTTMYYWSDGTQSQFSHDDNAFFRNQHGFDAQGFRPSNYGATGDWPTDRQLAGAEGRMLFWDNKTFHYLMDESGNFALDLTQDPLPLSELGKGGNQPDWSNKRLVGVAKTWQWMLFFWHDGTHSLYDIAGDYWAFYTDGLSTGFRPNAHYGIPNDKRISAVEVIDDEDHAWRFFWFDGTHSESRSGNLTKNTDGFDEHGYRSNQALPDWAPPTPIAVVDWSSDTTMYYWSDGTQSQFSHDDNAFFRNQHGFDAQGFRPSNYGATGDWPTDRQLAGAEGRMLFWDNKTFHYLMDESGNFALDLTQDPLPLSELGKGGNQPDWSNKRLVGVAKTCQWMLFFWHDGTHSLYDIAGDYWAFYTDGLSTGFRPNAHYGIPNDKRISAVEVIDDEDHAWRFFWFDGTHSESRSGNLTKNTDGFDEHGYRSNQALPDWAPPTPIAVVDWSSDTTMYYWSDGTQSQFSHDDNAFFRNQHGFDAQGFRPSNYGATGDWPTDRQLAGAEGRMLFWDNKTFHYLMDESGNFALDLTQDPLPLSELGKGGNQPDWSNKRLVGVAKTWQYIAFFWHDGTHSLYAYQSDYWYSFASNGFRSNAIYGFPNDKRISAVEAIGDKKNKFRIFWFDGTHSESKGGNLTKNTDGFDEHGYRSNKELPDWTF